jgi:hypothetical protein
MREIYKNANSVLVLDADMLNVSPDSDMREIAIRVILSGWMQRLWILQELVLNRHVFIALGACQALKVQPLISKLYIKSFTADRYSEIQRPLDSDILVELLQCMLDPGDKLLSNSVPRADLVYD